MWHCIENARKPYIHHLGKYKRVNPCMTLIIINSLPTTFRSILSECQEHTADWS